MKIKLDLSPLFSPESFNGSNIGPTKHASGFKLAFETTSADLLEISRPSARLDFLLFVN